jgi:Domain of unknown function (DUF4129)
MRSFFQRKLWVVLLAALALGALTVLAFSLDNIPFNEAQHFVRSNAADTSSVSAQDVADAWAEVPIWKLVVVWGLISLMLLLVGLLISPELRKKLFRLFLQFVASVAAIFFLLRYYGPQLIALQQMAAQIGQQVQPANAQPMPTFQPPQISPVFSYLVSFAFALLWIAVMWGLYKGWQKYVALNARKPLDELAHIARSSLDDLASGRDSTDVIIKCYLRMSDVIADKRRIQREIAMTPQEFALRLERAGLPGDAVRRLTRLFEMVRYGDRKSAPKDVTEAVSCLNTILHYCGETI